MGVLQELEEVMGHPSECYPHRKTLAFPSVGSVLFLAPFEEVALFDLAQEFGHLRRDCLR